VGNWEEITHSQLPITNYQSPITNYQSPITNYQSPITNYQSPIPNPQLPITNYQLPITNYQLPITNYQFPNSPKTQPTGLSVLVKIRDILQSPVILRELVNYALVCHRFSLNAPVHPGVSNLIAAFLCRIW
jgi:hypothetical protein